ncbi:hypothetical protein [Burkholderia cepacia]|uniref:hypothetical protein n=1 Tax=Burkholderia cepacia TaxID=292 RepID=UPI00075759F4|nr:hypothetical protein [Burkholderia cepacia]KVU62547.1 hypothetical protein WK70_04815 [Burkholderia cepacia]KVX46663.1 hypothetical protein WL06_34860 [Burkholderia cepacia]KWD58260.1 hypothetical protein WL68_27875 [Burkholderia cepacia]KWD76175.1 hypothetical protein WL69_25045 [Burkholderia cepacia]
MTLKAGIDEIARSLDGLHPPWLPAYDLRAYAAKVDSECGYGSDMMVAIEINTRMFEEIVAFVHVCGAFASLQPSLRDSTHACAMTARKSTTCLHSMLPGHVRHTRGC